MISVGSVAGFWLLVLLALHGATLGGTQNLNSLGEPDVPFPPACPNEQNLAAICYNGLRRPRYLPSFFPTSGVSHWRRRGDAINRMESWYSVCCSDEVAQQNNQILCCAQQAWQQALSEFCTAEFSTMSRAYSCCRRNDRWACFKSEDLVINPDYEPIPGYEAPPVPLDPGFTWNPQTC